MVTRDKIYWYCFKQQLRELYYLLYFEKCISCSADEFISHFTGKKFKHDTAYSRKLTWEKGKYLLVVLTRHLTKKKFINEPIILKHHFVDIPDSIMEDYNRNKNKPNAKKLQAKLDILFPATTGYRCKQRLFYRERNKENEITVIKNLKINV